MENKKHKSRKAAVPIHLLKGEPNPFESDVDHAKVADLTDRVFRSVLGKYGWGQDEHGQIEHVGSGDQTDSRP